MRVPGSEAEELAALRPRWRELLALGQSRQLSLTQLQAVLKRDVAKEAQALHAQALSSHPTALPVLRLSCSLTLCVPPRCCCSAMSFGSAARRTRRFRPPPLLAFTPRGPPGSVCLCCNAASELHCCVRARDH